MIALLLLSLAHAQEPPAVHTVQVTEIDFSGLEISVAIGPRCCHCFEPAKSDLPPMVRVRRDFTEEMSDSARLIAPTFHDSAGTGE